MRYLIRKPNRNLEAVIRLSRTALEGVSQRKHAILAQYFEREIS